MGRRLNRFDPRFIAVTQNIDTDESNPMSRFMLHIFAAFAEFEREMIRERTVSGVRAAKAKGKKLGRPKRVFRRDEVTRLRESGKSWRAIAKHLGVPVLTVIDSRRGSGLNSHAWRRINRRTEAVIRTITIEREYGAGGGAIAKKLAGRLGWKLWDQALTCEIARVAQVDQAVVERMDERCDSLFYRLMKVFMRGSMEQSLPVRGMDHFDADSMVEFMQRVISGAASEGNSVIVGRGAPFFLRDHSDSFHVFVYAPLEEKIRRLGEEGKTEEEAADEIASVDRKRVIFVRKYFGMEWPTRELYHLMINSKVGDDVVIDTILNEIHSIGAQSIPADLNWARKGRS